MIQLILHLSGDYLFQTDWMAKNKKAKTILGFTACFIHCLIYALPFLFICSIFQTILIFVLHFLIDRWYFIKWYMNTFDMKDFAKPPFAPWSIFITDNTFHLICNYLVIYFVL